MHKNMHFLWDFVKQIIQNYITKFTYTSFYVYRSPDQQNALGINVF